MSCDLFAKECFWLKYKSDRLKLANSVVSPSCAVMSVDNVTAIAETIASMRWGDIPLEDDEWTWSEKPCAVNACDQAESLEFDLDLEVELETIVEYQPWWMSRVVLKQQLRRHSLSNLVGFNAHRRKNWRVRAQTWTRGFLQTFWPDVADDTRALLVATAR